MSNQEQSNAETVAEVITLFDTINENTSDNSPTKGVLFNLVKNPLALLGTGITSYFLLKAASAGSGAKLQKMNEAFKGRIMAQFATIGVICGVFYIVTRNHMSNSAAQDKFFAYASAQEYRAKQEKE